MKQAQFRHNKLDPMRIELFEAYATDTVSNKDMLQQQRYATATKCPKYVGTYL